MISDSFNFSFRYVRTLNSYCSPAMIGASTGFNIVPTFIPPALAVLGYALKK